jgi:hypothetical protein
MRARSAIKSVVVGSVIVSCLVAMTPATRRTVPTALDGAWVVTSFTGGTQTASVPQWKRLVIDRGVVGIRLATDSLIGCRGTVSATPGTLTLQCARNRQEELQWTRSGDTLRVNGTFDGAPLSASARYFAREDYRLFKSKFRWIVD